MTGWKFFTELEKEVMGNMLLWQLSFIIW